MIYLTKRTAPKESHFIKKIYMQSVCHHSLLIFLNQKLLQHFYPETTQYLFHLGSGAFILFFLAIRLWTLNCERPVNIPRLTSKVYCGCHWWNWHLVLLLCSVFFLSVEDFCCVCLINEDHLHFIDSEVRSFFCFIDTVCFYGMSSLMVSCASYFFLKSFWFWCFHSSVQREG